MYKMYHTRIGVAAIVSVLTWLVNSQQSGWLENQANATMCQWGSLRSAQLKDTLYLDGGVLYWVPGMVDGSYGVPEIDRNPKGYMYTLNFSTPWNSTTNISDILTPISKAPNGGSANNFAPNYVDGAMLANNDEFFLYGGWLRQSATLSPPDADEILGYQASQYGIHKDIFDEGFINDKLPDDMTRYLAYGGGANAPSENTAWYFGGYRSPSWGPIYEPSYNNSLNPVDVSNTLITLNMTTQQDEIWTNVTLPTSVPSRANPSVVWVPVGDQGILVVLGGVSYPEYNNGNATSQNSAQSEEDSPGYMSNIDIYDIANDQWYQQPTIAGPSQMAMGCAVVAPAQDLSSYNIYYYGGFDGIHGSEPYNDDVWILSLPSFMWMKVSSGTAEHARAFHQCVMPYPDQMVTIGGFRNGPQCLDGGILEVFNLTEGKWLDSYDPENWNNYGVPEMIHLMIGGGYTGGATMTTPTPTGWATKGLASVFATTYDVSKITTYFPYGSMGPGNGTGGSSGSGHGGTPSWVAPVLGVVLGLVFLTAIAVAILLYRRRKLWLKKKSNSQDTPEDNSNRVHSWLDGQQGKALTATTDEPSSKPDEMDSRNATPMNYAGYYHPSHHGMTEMPAPVAPVELFDTSRPMELSGDGLTHIDVINRHTRLSPTTPRSFNQSSSFFTGSISQEQESSNNSTHAAGPPVAPGTAYTQERADSPSLGNPSPFRSPPLDRNTIVSDMSRISERDAAHLRNISNTTASSMGNTASSRPGTPQAVLPFSPGPISPPLVSPPSALDGHAGMDYMSAHQGRSLTGLTSHPGSILSTNNTSRPSRNSTFREEIDDER
ncbi:hypothetical protein F5Y18DRAFT_46594 [Xylariaceae sp. FL1019]|nr:hypothetical protein F5Y18DRAFT_46594 [Xylariaceae sp. FL1019]